MNVRDVIYRLETLGYSLKADRDEIHFFYPYSEHPPDGAALLEALREHKAEALPLLRAREEMAPVNPADGELYEAVFNGRETLEARRWAYAARVGIIALEGRVRYHAKAGTVVLRYRYAFPKEWLDEHIRDAARVRHALVMKQFCKGDQWLRENGQHPEHGLYFSRFQDLMGELAQLYDLAGLDHHMVGYRREDGRMNYPRIQSHSY